MADKREHDAEAQRPFLAGESSKDVLQKMKVVEDEEDEPGTRKWTEWVRILAEVAMVGAIVVLLLRAWQQGKGDGEKPSPVPTCMCSCYYSRRVILGRMHLTKRRAEENNDVPT